MKYSYTTRQQCSLPKAKKSVRGALVQIGAIAPHGGRWVERARAQWNISQ